MLQDKSSEREETHYELVSQLKTFPSLHNSIKFKDWTVYQRNHKKS